MNRWLQALERQPSEGEDVDAQIDGDASPAFVQPSPFALAPGQQPWLREGLPPWHLWGNTQQFSVVSGAMGTGATAGGQLIKISYKRPDTWHWFFMARITQLSPLPAGVQNVGLQVDFDLIIGVGRSSIEMPSFDRFTWEAQAPAPQIILFQRIWSTQVLAPNKFQSNVVPPTAIANPLNQVTASDIQVNCRLSPTGVNNYVYDAQVEVSAYWAPKTHVRPDWFNNFDGVPPEKVFGGGETEGH